VGADRGCGTRLQARSFRLSENYQTFIGKGPRRSPGGDRKAPWSRPQARNLCVYHSQHKKGCYPFGVKATPARTFRLGEKRQKFIEEGAAKESRGRPQSPLVAPAGAKPCAFHSQHKKGCYPFGVKATPSAYFSSRRKAPKVYRGRGREGVQGETAKPPGRARRRETPAIIIRSMKREGSLWG